MSERTKCRAKAIDPKILYGYRTAREQMDKYDYVVITLGTENHKVLIQHGLFAVISLMALELDESVIDEVLSINKNVYLAFQSGALSKIESDKLNEKLESRNATVKYVTFPDLLQPANYVVRDGVDKLLNKLKNAKPFISGECFLPENTPKD